MENKLHSQDAQGNHEAVPSTPLPPPHHRKDREKGKSNSVKIINEKLR
jgi:hypothetical protein